MGQAKIRKEAGLMPINRLARFSHVCDLVLKARLTQEEKKRFYNRGQIRWGIIDREVTYVKNK